MAYTPDPDYFFAVYRDAVGQKSLEAAKLLVAYIVLFVMMVCRLDFSCRHS